MIDGKRDYAISFNYTETLETLYNLKEENICYIHGKREDDKELQKKKSLTSIGKDNCSLIVGFDIKQLEKKKSRNSMLYMYSRLVKNTEQIIFHHAKFFEKISTVGIKDIYSIGFSFSEVDIIYIKKLCSIFNEKDGTRNMIWYLSDFNTLFERTKFRMKLRKAGFKGTIKTYKLR